MAHEADTIVAIATAPFPSGIGVLRVSGMHLDALCRRLTGQSLPEPRKAALRRFFDTSGSQIDEGLLLFFPAPNSFTGEEVLEFQTHGSPVVLHELQEHCLLSGARLAQPGEFTLRAYLNRRMDLNQAEAVASLIHAASRQAAASAAKALVGHYSEAVDALVSSLIEQRIYLESHFDFSDEEDVPVYRHQRFREALEGLAGRLDDLTGRVGRGLLMQQGKKAVLIGVPNVGKSSLLNAITEEDHALVTPIPGTTRDVIRGYLVLDGIPVHLIDTAGIRDTTDPVEMAGIARTWQEAMSADLVLVVVDVRHGLTEEDGDILKNIPAHVKKLLIFNKIDVVCGDLESEIQRERNPDSTGSLWVSARTGQGLDELKRCIRLALQFEDGHSEEAFMVSERHLAALRLAREHILSAMKMDVEEFVAEDLKLAQLALLKISGKDYAADDLLGDIFAKFCIGK